MPQSITDLAACAAVIFITLKFLAELRALGASRDAEREKFLETLREERQQSHSAIVRIVGLAQSMVDRCQSAVPKAERISGDQVVQAGAERQE